MIDIAHHIMGQLAILESKGNPNEIRLAQELLKITINALGNDRRLRKIYRLASWRAGIIVRKN
jgi:hypothetical protein